MTRASEPTLPAPAGRPVSEAFFDLMSGADRMVERGDALEAYRAFDDGVLDEVPHALDAYMRHQRSALG